MKRASQQRDRATVTPTGRRRVVAEPLERRTFLSAVTRLYVGGIPDVVTAGVPVTATVDCLDGFGWVDQTADLSITLSVYDGTLRGWGAVPVRTLTAPAVDGVATFDGLVFTTAQPQNVAAETASVSALSNDDGFDVVPAAATAMHFYGQPTKVDAGRPFYVGLDQVEFGVGFTDAFGNGTTVGQPTVTVTSTDGHTVAYPPPTTSASAGFVKLTDFGPTRAGQQTLTATAAGMATIESAPFTVRPLGPVSFSFVSPPVDRVAGQPSDGVTVRTLDPFGNDAAPTAVMEKVDVSFIRDGQLSGTSTVNLTSGTAVAFVGSPPDRAGTYTVRVGDYYHDNIGSVAGVTSPTFVVSPGPVTKLVIPTGSPTLIVEAGRPLPDLPVARQDDYGNDVAAAPGTTFTVTSTGPLDGTTTRSAESGRASFAGLIVPTAGTFTLTATDGLLPPVDLTVTVRPALLAATTTVAGRSIGVMTIDADAYFPDWRQLHGPAIPRVQFSLVGGRLDSPYDIDDLVRLHAAGRIVNGFVRIRLPTLTRSGNYLVSATGVWGTASTTFTVQPAAAARVAFDLQPVRGTTGYAARVRVADRFGNPAEGTAVTLASATPAGSPVGGPFTVAAGADGVARFDGFAMTPGRRLRLRAGVPHGPSVVSRPFDAT